MSKQIPPAAMPLISPSAFLLAHLKQTPPTRPSHRTPSQPQPIETNIGSLTHCNGSSLVKIGATSIVCGVRAEVLLVSDIPSYRVSKSTSSKRSSTGPLSTTEPDESELYLYNLLVPNLELSTGCSPLHPANAPPSAEAQSLSHRLLSLLLTSKLIRLSDLSIYHTPDPTLLLPDQDPSPQLKGYWVLYIDMLCISYGGSGSVFDCAWLALYAALRDTLLPRTMWDIDEKKIYCDPDVSQASSLSLRGAPVPLSFGSFEGHILVGLDVMEEECCAEKGSVTVDENRIVRLEKWGGSGVGIQEIGQIMELAKTRWTEWRTVLSASDKITT
jgi:exosome complex component RRP43